MKFVAWLTDGTWQACVDAVAEVAPPDAEIVLLHVIDPSMTEGLHGAYAGLFGRGGRGPDPGDAIEVATLTAEAELFAAAEARARREAPRASHRGRPEREVIAAAADAALLVVAKGRRPLSAGAPQPGARARFVVDHEPCRVLLIWPDEPPSSDTIPAQPEHHDQHGPD